jgi:hypothetical protein
LRTSGAPHSHIGVVIVVSAVLVIVVSTVSYAATRRVNPRLGAWLRISAIAAEIAPPAIPTGPAGDATA